MRIRAGGSQGHNIGRHRAGVKRAVSPRELLRNRKTGVVILTPDRYSCREYAVQKLASVGKHEIAPRSGTVGPLAPLPIG